MHTVYIYAIFYPFPGYMVVPAGGGGTFLGGYIVKRLNLRCRGIIRFCMICAVVSLLAIFIFLIHCPNVPMAGVTAPYQSGLMEENHLQLQYKHMYDVPSKLRLRNRWAVFMFVRCVDLVLASVFRFLLVEVTYYLFDY